MGPRTKSTEKVPPPSGGEVSAENAGGEDRATHALGSFLIFRM